MAEEFARNRQYEYRANSNLVLEADRENRRRTDEPTGEVESLFGKMGGQKMGDKLGRNKAPDLEEKARRAKASREKRQRGDAEEHTRGKRKRRSGAEGDDGGASGAYEPKTKEARGAYEAILAGVRGTMGDVPRDVLRGAADEVLYTLKDDRVKDPDKHVQLERLFGAKVAPERFAALVALGKQIVDFGLDEQARGRDGGDGGDDGGALDEEMGVAVVFDEDESDEEEQDVDEVHSEEDDDDAARGVEAEHDSKLLTGVEDDDGDGDDHLLDVHAIDAHWLQRGIGEYYDDANVSAKLADDVLAILGPEGGDDRECENRLVMLLDYDKFDFIKLLLSNRRRVLYCTQLKQAQSDEDRKAVEAAMVNDVEGGGAAILEALHEKGSAETWAQDRAADFASRTRKEAVGLSKLQGVRLDDDEAAKLLEAEATKMDVDGAPGHRAPSQVLDLQSLAFAKGGHQMTNKRCELPPKSWRAQKKGYEEVHVPAVVNTEAAKIPLIPIDKLPAWARPAFGGMKTLNTIQSKLLPAALEGSGNLLLCAPTGAGKTNVAVLTMLNCMARYRTSPDDDASLAMDLGAFKIVYVAPMKALVQECVLNFGKRLAPYGVSVKELSGDQSLTYQQIQETQVIVTTPEKWDIVTRKGGDRAYTQLVKLLIMDEIHLLHDDRGPVLESVVARTIRQVETTRDAVRLLGLSATLPNFADVATLLRVDPSSGLFFFDNSFRPVPLQQQYVGVAEKKAIKRFQLMNQICYEKTLAQAGRNQVLIFVHSRAETAKTAAALRDMALSDDTISRFVREDSATREILQEECETAKSEALRDLLPYGFAIHHAGMTRADRNLVEDLFADKHIQVLCSTATLAWGVNLPAHTVIIKGTQIYSPEKGKWTELSPLDIVQMMGRAGRPQFDSEGEGIIITRHSELQYYLSLMNQQLPVESQLVKHLPDHLNAEIEMGSVQTIKQAADWIAYTYLYVRALQEPERYGATPDDGDESLLQYRLDLAHSAALVLDKHNLVKYDRKSGGLAITALGRVAAHYYVSYASMATYNEHLKPTLSDIELFRLFSFSGEFKHIHVREEEKLELAKLATRVPIPIKESMEEPSAKVNALLQAYISNLSLEGFALVADMTFVRQSAARLCRALFEIALKRKWAGVAAKALTLCKMVERKLWLSQSPLRQFKGVPETIVRKLEKKEIPWDRYYDLKPQDLAELVKLPKMGKTLHRLVHQVPRVELSAHVQPVSRGLLKVDLTITPDFIFDPKVHDYAQTFHVLVEDVDGERILHHEPFSLKHKFRDEEHVVQFAIPVGDPLPPQYFLKVVSDRWLHSAAVLPISFRHLILPRKYPPHTELLDLQPLPATALGSPKLEALFAGDGRYFNPIQTQAFSVFYETDDNALLCAPHGSGRLVCCEFALLRAVVRKLAGGGAGGACVYVAPRAETVASRLARWRAKFAPLGAAVDALTGDVTSDLRLVANSEVVLATASQWDVLSRRWKQRKALQGIALFVADELHCLGSPEGPTLEVVVSRTRYMSSQLEKPVRVIGLAASVADAKDVADWLGCSAPGTFSFHSNVRPIPMELFLHAFDTPHFASRLLAMGKTLYNVLNRHSPAAPALVFVTSRKQCQLAAIDLMVHAAADPQAASKRERYMALGDDELGAFEDPALQQTLARGVAFVHGGLSSNDRAKVLDLYARDLVWALCAPAEACRDVDVSAHMVVVMGTESYDAKEHRYVDYAVGSLLEMIGKAGRPGVDEDCKCAVLCHTPKKDYLRRLLYEPLPVESHLDHDLHDHVNAEIVTKTIENKQDAVDYLTWTFYYRRLAQNPNYYNLQGGSHRHVSDHLSELVENVVGDLEEAQCVAVDDEMDLSALNLGMIAAYYCVKYTTVELFASSVAKKSKIPALLEVVSNAAEFGDLAARHHETGVLEKLALHAKHKLPSGGLAAPQAKANLLLQSHFSRVPLSAELRADRDGTVAASITLLQALVDVVSSNGWLAPALHAMELCQMVVQGLWHDDAALLQIPHVDGDTLARAAAAGATLETAFDVLDLEDDVRDKILALGPAEMADVADWCNDFPNVELQYAVDDADGVVAGEPVSLTVTLERDVDDDMTDIGRVRAARFPGLKKEGWWLVVADVKNNALLSIKRVSLLQTAKVSLDFVAPEAPGTADLTLYFVCDSYLGCDQEYEFALAVQPGTDA